MSFYTICVSTFIDIACLIGFFYIFSINEVTFTVDEKTNHINRTYNNENKALEVMYLVLLAGNYFLTILISYKSTFVISSAVASYYFSSSSESYGDSEIMTGFRHAYFYHLGSFAYGSFIMTLLFMMKVMVRCLRDAT